MQLHTFIALFEKVWHSKEGTEKLATKIEFIYRGENGEDKTLRIAYSQYEIHADKWLITFKLVDESANESDSESDNGTEG